MPVCVKKTRQKNKKAYLAAALGFATGALARRNCSTIRVPSTGGVAVDARRQLGSHRRDDALPHAGGARVGLGVEADAVVGDRELEILADRLEFDVNGTGAVGVGVFDGVHHQFVDDDADRHGAIRIDLDRLGLQGQPRHLVALGGAPQIFQQRLEILVQQHAFQIVRGVKPAVDLRDRSDASHRIGQRRLDVFLRRGIGLQVQKRSDDLQGLPTRWLTSRSSISRSAASAA